MRRALIVSICVLGLLPVIAQQPPPPIYRAGVDVVAVDVHVVDRGGRPVPDLRPEEFLITVDGKPRSIVAADYVSHGVNTSATPAAGQKPRPVFTSNWIGRLPAPGRTILLVVDEENIRAGSARAAAQAAGQFLDRLQPADRVGLVVMPRTGVAIDPTTDRARVKEALTHISGHLVVGEYAARHDLRAGRVGSLREAARAEEVGGDRRAGMQPARRPAKLPR